MQNVFRRHNDGHATDVFEDAATWVRDGESDHITTLDGTPLDYPDVPTSFDGLRALMRHEELAGVVFTHADGRQAQVTRAELGLEG